ncbi:MAG: hypothetical protein KAG61_04310 [Bacteriovoracaceae bacterium]|nr:hypothetical protein [Bacteriovoracaceae bacterium]
MAYLFLDTTDHLIVGLLSEKFEWIEYYESEERKSSAKIHGLIHELSKKHSIDLASLDGVIQVAGPGSYTGMRVSDGISQILEWSNIKSYGVYHFDVPQLLGEKNYCWYANAFKGETFILEVENGKTTKHLKLEEEAKEFLHDKLSVGNKIFTNFESDSVFLDTFFSSSILKSCPEKIFPKIIEDDSVTEIYYYRSLEDEFRPCRK